MPRLRLFVPLVIFLGLAVLFWKGLSLDPNYMPSALENRPLPAFSARTLEGGALTDKDLQGRPVLLNVWATWCPSCAAEHAYLNELSRRGVTIYGVNYKDDAEAARRWIDPNSASRSGPSLRLLRSSCSSNPGAVQPLPLSTLLPSRQRWPTLRWQPSSGVR